MHRNFFIPRTYLLDIQYTCPLSNTNAVLVTSCTYLHMSLDTPFAAIWNGTNTAYSIRPLGPAVPEPFLPTAVKIFCLKAVLPTQLEIIIFDKILFYLILSTTSWWV